MAHLNSILIKRREGKGRKFQSQKREGKSRDSGEGRVDYVVRNNKQITLAGASRSKQDVWQDM